MKFNDYAEEFLEMETAYVRKSTHMDRVHMYKLHIAPYWSGVDIDDITSPTAQKYLNWLCERKCATGRNKGEPLSKKHVNDIFSFFKQIMYEAMRAGIIKEFVIRTKTPINIRETDQEYQMLKDDDYSALMRFCTNSVTKTTVGIMFALLAGLRIGEICGLQWRDIDFDNRTISVNKGVSRIYDPISHTTELNIHETKTKAGKRKVPISQTLYDYLRIWQTKYIDECGKSIDYYVIGIKEKPNEPRTLRQGAARVFNRLGIDYIHFHNLRHTFCSKCVQAGVDLKITSEFMGHANTNITANIYTHTTDRQKQAGIEIFDAFICARGRH